MQMFYMGCSKRLWGERSRQVQDLSNHSQLVISTPPPWHIYLRSVPAVKHLMILCCVHGCGTCVRTSVLPLPGGPWASLGQPTFNLAAQTCLHSLQWGPARLLLRLWWRQPPTHRVGERGASLHNARQPLLPESSDC